MKFHAVMLPYFFTNDLGTAFREFRRDILMHLAEQAPFFDTRYSHEHPVGRAPFILAQAMELRPGELFDAFETHYVSSYAETIMHIVDDFLNFWYTSAPKPAWMLEA